ncbi:MAG TPA: hypothetical protein VM266_06475 [Solirubrobacteraceae bacterium]|nr:hypothetical protein [Solirubrobacteraceae bacterium]
MTPRAAAAAALAGVALAAAVAPAAAAPTRAQELFRRLIVADRMTTEPIVDLLRTGGGFVSRTIAYEDLTGDGRQDAVVRVESGGAAGAVALYVFSTHGRAAGTDLRAIHRRQKLVRATTRVRRGVLTFRSSRYADGDQLCCPSEIVETRLRWDDKRKRFRVARTRDVDPPAPE